MSNPTTIHSPESPNKVELHNKAKEAATITVLYFAAAQTATRGRYSDSITLSSLITFHNNHNSIPISSSFDPARSSEEEEARVPLSLLAAYIISLYPSPSTPPSTSQPSLAQVLESSAWSVNEEMIPKDDSEEGNVMLKAGDVVAVIPPVSGG